MLLVIDILLAVVEFVKYLVGKLMQHDILEKRFLPCVTFVKQFVEGFENENWRRSYGNGRVVVT